MTKRDAARQDDWKDDPLNPTIPFRMSDRLTIYGLEVKVNVVVALSLLVAGLVGAGMALHYI